LKESTLAALGHFATAKDEDRIRAIILDPAVAPTFFIDGAKPEDFDFARSCEVGWWVITKGSAFWLVELIPGIVEVHAGVLPAARGERAVEDAEVAAFLMFTRTNVMEIIGQTPVENRAAQWFDAMCGFRPVTIRQKKRVWSKHFLDWILSRENPWQVARIVEGNGFTTKADCAKACLTRLFRGEQHGS
jgi:hypothetical protein